MTALLLIAMVLAFILVDYVVQLRQAKVTVPVTARKPAPLFSQIEDLLPKGVFAAPGHIWSTVLPNGHVRMGASRLILNALQTVSQVVLPDPGKQVKKGDVLFTVHWGDRQASFRAPASGRIAAVNSELMQHPMRLSGDTNSSWAVVLQPDNLSASVKAMRIGEEAYQLLRNEVNHLRDFFARFSAQPAMASALQDGGLPVAGALQNLPDDVWQKFVHEFIETSAAETQEN